MSKIFFSFFTAALATLSVCKGGRLPMLTCKETEAAHLITLPVNCTYSKAHGHFEEYNCTQVRQSPKGDEWIIAISLRWIPYLAGIEKKDTNEENRRCVMMCNLKGSAPQLGITYILTFAFNIIGIVTTIVDDDLSSVFRADIRADVLESPPFARTPDDPLFWNFSSPLFRADLGWLRSFSAEAALEEHYPTALPGLAGSSLVLIELIGSFGTDLNGPVPSFNDLPLLETLVMKNSPMVNLPPEYLAHSGGITWLVLLKNKFPDVPKAIGELKDLTKLIFESLVENFIFYPNTLNRLVNLESLTLAGTHIEHWSEKFGNLTSLEELNLSRCKMRRFSAALSNFPKLRNLDLSENLLTFLPENALAGLGQLNSIDLSRNAISHLPGNLLTSLRDLETLSLALNNLIDWPRLPCNRFQTINMSNNHLTNLINLGQHIRAVNELDISNNKISEWKDQNIFFKDVTCGQNNSIDFKSSKKQHITSSLHFDVPKLLISFVNISNNGIATFSEEMVDSLTFLDVVDLGGNVIDCADCQTSLLQRWLDSTRIKVRNLGQNTPLQCHQPKDFKNQFVQNVNFEVCFIPHRYLWLGIGAPTVGVISIVVIGGVLFYYRTEVVYLAHLAKVRATSRKQQSHAHSSYDAFVCYSGKNRKWVNRRLVPLLERRPERYVLCLFDRDFRLGTHIVSNIVDAIEHSRKVIVVLSQHFIDSKWCQWELEMAQHKLFSEDREFLVLLELEPLERRRLPRLLRFLLDTRPVVRWPRPETAPAVMAAAAELRAVLGPSLRQNLLADPPAGDEPRPSCSAEDKLVLVANESGVANDSSN